MSSNVASMIDHTLLKPEATAQDVAALIEEAHRLGTYSVCISPSQLPVEVPEGLHVATVVGFPPAPSSRRSRPPRQALL